MSMNKHNEICIRFYFYIIKWNAIIYEQMTITSLKNLAREMGKTRYSGLRKSELIKKLREQTPPREPTRKG